MSLLGELTIAIHLNRYYDVRPSWPKWTWSVFEVDFVTKTGAGIAQTRIEAELAARECIVLERARRINCLAGNYDSFPALQLGLALPVASVPNQWNERESINGVAT